MTKERRYILIGGIILLVFGALYRFYPDIQETFSLESEIIRKKKNLATYQGMVQERGELETHLKFLEEQLKLLETGLLIGETAAIAAVDIQIALNEIAERHEIEIRSMQVMKPEGQKDEPYLAVPVQVSIETNARGLKNILYGIETSPKALRVGELRIRVLRGGVSERIQATFTVTGYMKKI